MLPEAFLRELARRSCPALDTVLAAQPRLAEQGIETPALPYSNTNYLQK